MVQYALALDPDLPVRLEVIEALTGTPESTLREACLKEEIRGAFKKKTAWHCTINAYREWVIQGDQAAKGEGGGLLGEVAQRQMAPSVQEEGTGRVGLGRDDQDPGAREPKGKARHKRKARAVVYDAREILAQGEGRKSKRGHS